jgi:hypothetical protein
MYYNVQCTNIGMYIFDFLKILFKIKMSQKFSEICLAVFGLMETEQGGGADCSFFSTPQICFQRRSLISNI